jgi:hypothetical protein
MDIASSVWVSELACDCFPHLCTNACSQVCKAEDEVPGFARSDIDLSVVAVRPTPASPQ